MTEEVRSFTQIVVDLIYHGINLIGFILEKIGYIRSIVPEIFGRGGIHENQIDSLAGFEDSYSSFLKFRLS
jgi:hypothetical protein